MEKNSNRLDLENFKLNSSFTYVFVSFILLFSLSFESIPFPIQAQIKPLTSLLSIVFLPIFLLFYNNIKITPLFKYIVLFLLFVITHSIIALIIDVFFLEAGNIRIISSIRQLLALLGGTSVFIILRETLQKVSDEFIVYSILIGGLPALITALLNVVWGLSGNKLIGDIVVWTRSFFVSGAFTSSSRATGLSLEPSHFAFFLVIILLPIGLVMFSKISKKLGILLLSLIIISFIWTFSTIGLIVLLGLLLGGFLFSKRKSSFILTTGIILLCIGVFVVLFPQNYASFQIKRLVLGDWGVSINTRFYSSFGPFINLFDSYVSIGYGLGGTATHFREIVPDIAQQEIASVSWENMPNLNTLLGRIIAETGLIGLLLSFLIFKISFNQVKTTLNLSKSDLEISLLKYSRFVLIAFLVGSSIAFGSFVLPYIWFWLAFIDSRYINKIQQK